MTHIKLLEPFDTGEKILPVNTVVAMNRSRMNDLVRSGKAYFCNHRGQRVLGFEPPGDEEE